MTPTTYQKLTLEPGTYMTREGLPVTALKILSPGRALFVSPDHWPTPFVSWEYKLLTANDIELYCGEYYATLDDALKAECNNSKTSASIELDISFFCPHCETLHVETFTLSNVHDLMTAIEDYRVVCPACDVYFMGIHHITVKDQTTPGGYELPLWHGPVPEEVF